MKRFKSKIGKIVELTNEREKHIIEYHPDVKTYLPKIPEVLENPDEIRKSGHDPEVLLFYKYFATIRKDKYLAVVVRINKRNFILTCYLTDKLITGEKFMNPVRN